ncbi:ABC transporter ATP-binding protein [Halocatena halophila]|uniref:ABC transporter ATP-binding protein n=1 Tax=Halocatena halophila TaxID=2814576 RepID=UPI002ED580F4
MNDPVITVDGVRVSYDERTVLENVSLTVDAGTFVGIVGPNGAGKTTLLQTINGVTAPDDGTVTIQGKSVQKASAREIAQRVGTVPQEAPSGFSFPVRDVVAMGRHPHRSRFDRSDPQTAITRAMERTETVALADRTIDTLSGGERQRVRIARAVAQETPALVLDEPTASLDIAHQVRTLELVQSLVNEGKAAVAAIHDLDLAARYCDVVAILSGGTILDSGPPAAVVTPSTIETAYGESMDVHVHQNPVTKTPSVTTIDERTTDLN